MLPLVINKDVWTDVMSYFAISLNHDRQDEIKAKRQCLLSLSLTSSELTDIALDELWKSMDTLLLIICVFDCVASGSSDSIYDPATNYDRAQNAWNMHFCSGVIRATAAGRAETYLARIRHFRQGDVGFNEQECSLWHTLSSFFWPSPTLPHLKDLFLNLIFRNKSRALEMAYHITSLISPTLRSLTLRSPNPSPSDEKISVIILTILQHRQVDITSLVYGGWISPRIISLIFANSSLQTITIPHWQPEFRVTLVTSQLLEGNVCLKKLDMNLGIFAEPDTLGMYLRKVPLLAHVTLWGTLDEIYSCIEAYGTTDTIQSLKLGLHGRGGRSGLMALVGSNFPNLRTFAIEAATDEADEIWRMPLKAILQIREKPLQSLTVRGFNGFASETEDHTNIATSFPKLQHLDIRRTDGNFNRADIVLSSYSQHAVFLRDATLPLNLPDLANLHLSHPTSHCPLERLSVPKAGTDSCTASQLARIAANLVILFPKISSIQAFDGPANTNMNELQNILAMLQQLVVHFPEK